MDIIVWYIYIAMGKIIRERLRMARVLHTHNTTECTNMPMYAKF